MPQWMMTAIVTAVLAGAFAGLGALIDRAFNVKWGRVLSIVGIAAGLALSRYAGPAVETFMWSDSDTERVIQQVNSPTFVAMKDAVPAEYAALIRRLTEERKRGASTESVVNAVNAATTEIRQRYANQALLASDAQIVLMLYATMEIHEDVYRRWPADCGKFAMEGGIYLVRSGKAKAMQTQLDAASVRFFGLLKEAMAEPVQRGPATDQDYVVFQDFLTGYGMTPEEIDVVVAADANDPRSCPALIKFMKGALDLPDPEGSRVRADLLKNIMVG